MSSNTRSIIPKNKSTHSEFIALIADKLQLQLKSTQVGNF